VGALAAPNTINTMPEETLLAFGEHGSVDHAIPRDGGDAEQVLVAIARAGVDAGALARQLQDEGAKGFVDSWKELLGAIETKSKALT
jgi:transaldolase